MDEKTIKQRIRAVRLGMRKNRLDCLILTGEENVRYITGFSGHDSWVIIGRRVCLVTDSRYTELAKKQCLGCRIVERKGPIVKAVAEIIAKTKSIQTAGVEDRCSVAVFKQLKKHIKVPVKPIAGIIESIRRTKDDGEIRAIAAAARTAWCALDRTLRRIRIGMTETDLAGMLDFEIRKLGSQNSFDTIVAFGANASCPHYQPAGRRLRKVDTILIDFGARYKGYCSDHTRCFAVGRRGKFYQKVYHAVIEAQAAAIKAVRPGVDVKTVDDAARGVLTLHNLPPHGHGTGHGLGLEVHEGPVVSSSSKDRLDASDVITIEPGAYIPGRVGVRIEDDILVTGTGCRVLSKDRRFGFSRQISEPVPLLRCR